MIHSILNYCLYLVSAIAISNIEKEKRDREEISNKCQPRKKEVYSC